MLFHSYHENTRKQTQSRNKQTNKQTRKSKILKSDLITDQVHTENKS